jgi:hypothetical protein
MMNDEVDEGCHPYREVNRERRKSQSLFRSEVPSRKYEEDEAAGGEPPFTRVVRSIKSKVRRE